MAYLTNMPATCRSRSTNPEHALDLLDSIRREFDKSFDGGIFDATYVSEKLTDLARHVKWLEQEATKERAAESDQDESEQDESEQFSSGYNGGYGQSTWEDDRE